MNMSFPARSDAASAGAMLAAAREELNLTVSDVARHLKLSPAQVEALEEGAYDRLPGRVFVRGFLRNYAKLLGVDPQPLLRRIEHDMPKPKVVDEPPPTQESVMPTGERSRWPAYFGVIATLIAALAAYEFGFNSPPEANEPAKPTAAPTQANTPAPPAPAASATASPATSPVAPAPPAGASVATGAPL